MTIKFALVHSFLADKRVKNFAKYVFGERTYYGFYRLIYNIYSVAMLAPVWYVMGQDTVILWQIAGTWQTGFVIIGGVGIIGLLISLLQIDLLRFAGLKQVWAYFSGGALPLSDEPLITTGLYRFVRHPLYFFSFFALWFVPTMSRSYFVFCLLATLYFVVGSRFEERRMVNAYGERYRNYQQDVPWLLPLPNNRI